jgi:hypothetical protein
MKGRWIVGIIILAAMPQAAIAGEQRLLPAEEWLMPRSGDRLLDWPPLAATVREWIGAEVPSRIVIEYPGGEQGSLWVAELEDWLVTLGVPEAAIFTRPGGPVDGLTVWVEPLEERNGH